MYFCEHLRHVTRIGCDPPDSSVATFGGSSSSAPLERGAREQYSRRNPGTRTRAHAGRSLRLYFCAHLRHVSRMGCDPPGSSDVARDGIAVRRTKARGTATTKAHARNLDAHRRTPSGSKLTAQSSPTCDASAASEPNPQPRTHDGGRCDLPLDNVRLVPQHTPYVYIVRIRCTYGLGRLPCNCPPHRSPASQRGIHGAP